MIPDMVAIEWRNRKVFIGFDSDAVTKENVRSAEWHLSQILAGAGAIVRIIRLPAEPDGAKNGLDDYLVRHGADALCVLINEASEPVKPKRDDDRPLILIGADEHRVVDEAVAALAHDPTIYQRAGLLARVVNTDEEETCKVIFPSGPRIIPLSAATLRERLTFVADWIKTDGEGDKPAAPPQPITLAVLDRANWPGVRRLTAIVEYPVVLPDGSILSKSGYDPTSGLMYSPRCPVDLSVPDSPTHEDARHAVAQLLDVVSEFPFAAECHKAAWIASLLTPLARFAFRGCTPLFLAEANVPGEGKGLLTDAAAIIVRGAGLTVTTLPDDGSEFRKRVTALLIRGSSMVLFDNLSGRLGCAELDALLTSPVWGDRVLGESRVVEIPVLTTWFGTGNNLIVKADTLRRVCPIRLESPLERPEERTDLKHPDLRGWVIRERPRLLAAALTILRAYHGAGLPDMQLPSWGSFEDWSRVVRGCVVWAGLSDPWQGRQALRDERGDDTITAMAGLMRSWNEIGDDAGLTVASIVKRIDGLGDADDLAEMLLAIAGPKPDAGQGEKRVRTLAYRIREFAGRVVAGRRWVQVSRAKGLRRWRVDAIDTPSTPHRHPTDPSLFNGLCGESDEGGVDGADGADVPPTRAHAPTHAQRTRAT